MEDSGITDQIQQFLNDHISSVGQLEMLLLLQTNPQQKWTAAEIARNLRTETGGTQPQLDMLMQSGLVKKDDLGGYSYAPANDALRGIGQYEKSVLGLDDYYRTVELGLGLCFRKAGAGPLMAEQKGQSDKGAIGAIVFGSDQGLVGQFNDVVADFAIQTLASLPGKPEVWAVGERVHARLTDAGLPLVGLYPVPSSVKAIIPLVGQIQIDSEARRAKGEYARVYVFHNRPKSGALYEPVSQRLLPLDAQWQQVLAKIPWPAGSLPEVIGAGTTTLRSLIREYLFISLFRACAESLASENASRLAAMQRADKNINELLENLNRTFHRIRQDGIDEELFDVVSGFEALNAKET